MSENLQKLVTNLPSKAGVYFFKDAKNTIIYIGKAKNLKIRVRSYFRKTDDFKVMTMLPNIKYIDYMITADEEEAFLWENTLIKRFHPKYNILLKDGKTYPYLKISNEKYPCIHITRKIENDGAEYFGPYVEVETLKNIIGLIKKIFLIRKCKKKLNDKKENRACLNFFMGKCLAPCFNEVNEKDYKSFIKDIKLFVKFDYTRLLKKWETEIKNLIKQQKFEKAEIVKQRIFVVNKLNNFDIKVWEIKEADIKILQKIYEKKEDELANLENVLDIPTKIKTIAGFDISNISGKYAVGSRVVFVDGKPAKDKYRKYQIKQVPNDKPNDFAMMGELLDRTLNADDIESIDLLVIDGGKGQLNIANQIMQQHKKNIPIISIAKKQETIFLPNQQNGIQLPESSEILKLIRYIRDEAHRFAVSYHKKLRSKIQ
jgi:excinuclease ABC subunit C